MPGVRPASAGVVRGFDYRRLPKMQHRVQPRALRNLVPRAGSIGMICAHWSDGFCGSDDAVRVYLQGPRCQTHTPAAQSGRPDHLPDPTLTLNALRATKGIVWAFRLNDTALNDE